MTCCCARGRTTAPLMANKGGLDFGWGFLAFAMLVAGVLLLGWGWFW